MSVLLAYKTLKGLYGKPLMVMENDSPADFMVFEGSNWLEVFVVKHLRHLHL